MPHPHKTCNAKAQRSSTSRICLTLWLLLLPRRDWVSHRFNQLTDNEFFFQIQETVRTSIISGRRTRRTNVLLEMPGQGHPFPVDIVACLIAYLHLSTRINAPLSQKAVRVRLISSETRQQLRSSCPGYRSLGAIAIVFSLASSLPSELHPKRKRGESTVSSSVDDVDQGKDKRTAKRSV